MKHAASPPGSPSFAEGLLFLGIAVATTSLIWSGLFLIDPADNPWAGGQGMGTALLALFVAGGAVPSVLGLLLAGRRGGWSALVGLLHKAVPRAADLPWVLLALSLPLAAAALARVVGQALGATPLAVDLSALPQAAAMALAAAVMEEFGWRGTALPALCTRLSLARGGLAVGVLWGLWHSVGGVWSLAPMLGDWFAAYYLTGVLGTMAGASLALAALWHATDGRLFAVMVFHLAFSSSTAVLAPAAGDPKGVVLVATCLAATHLVAGALTLARVQARERTPPAPAQMHEGR